MDPKYIDNAILEIEKLKKRIVQLEEGVTGTPGMGDLKDVDVSGLADGHLLLYEAVSQTWKTMLNGTTMIGWTGQVTTYANLPPAAAHNDEIWLVEQSSGVWLVARKTAGLYQSDGATWNRIGNLVDFYSDANFEIYDDADNSKKAKFDASGISPGQVRSYAFPDKSGTLALLDDAVYTHPDHSGEVTSTGDGAQVVSKTAISNKPLVTVEPADTVLVGDDSDSNNLKRATVQSIADKALESSSYVHTQAVPASVWNVSHNLGYFSSVTIVDTGDNTIIGEVHYADSNSVTLSFSSAFSGRAFFS